MSSTYHAVVVEALKKSLRIAEECQKQCILVTYDLVMAKWHTKFGQKRNQSLTTFHLEIALFMLTVNLLQNLVDLTY